jgi:peptidoglycan hydrolase CwlO-like protein
MNRFFRCLFICLFLFSYSNLTFAQEIETQADKEIRLKNELSEVEKQIAENEKILVNTQNQTASLKRDILILDTKIKTAQLNIKAKNIAIEALGKDINKKQEKINSLEERINRGKETLAQIMRKTNEVDDLNLPEFLLTRQNLTNFLSDLDNFESVQESLKLTFEQIRDDKSETEAEKNQLSRRKDKELDAKAAIETEKKNIENDEKEKQRLLVISKGNEKAYSALLSERKSKAAQIRAALFSLRDSAAIPFELALKYANEASKSTGIRPAFLLAILTQESSLGKNVGTCYLTNPSTGAGVSVKSGTNFSNVMKPGRDVEPFIQITKSLDMDYSKTLVSCPIAGAGGYGGAMGPAQFIASTWMLFKDKISRATGVNNPNPWNPEHAFIASAIYLTELGAYSGSYTAEKNAACKYYSGKICNTKSVNNSYGVQVMAKADNIQRNMINPLQGL